jgi:hypothetical protein
MVVITPTDPQVLYVPQYQPADIWGGVGEAVAVGAMAFGTAAVIDAIFDDDDDWDDYWGCRDCGGWNGRPIIRDPDIDIDVDGDVNLGGRDIDLGDRDIDLGDRERNVNLENRDIDLSNRDVDLRNRGDSDGIGWKPDPDRGQEARDKIAAKRGEGGATTLPVRRPDGRTDALRDKLERQSGVPDISREGISRGDVSLPEVDRPSNRPAADKAAALRNTKTPAKAGAKKHNVSKKAAAKKAPKVKKAAGSKKGKGLSKTASGHKAMAASHRGKTGKAKRHKR